jgi:hypothetical protein
MSYSNVQSLLSLEQQVDNIQKLQHLAAAQPPLTTR